MTRKESDSSWADIREKLQGADVNVPVETIKPINRNQQISDEYLELIFTSLKNKYTDAAKLKIALRGVIPIRNSKKGKSVVPSNYLRRLSKLTKKIWRQKKALHPDDERLLVKIYTDGPYVSPAEKDRHSMDKFHQELEIKEHMEDLFKGSGDDDRYMALMGGYDALLMEKYEKRFPGGDPFPKYTPGDLRYFLDRHDKEIPMWLDVLSKDEKLNKKLSQGYYSECEFCEEKFDFEYEAVEHEQTCPEKPKSAPSSSKQELSRAKDEVED